MMSLKSYIEKLHGVRYRKRISIRGVLIDMLCILLWTVSTGVILSKTDALALFDKVFYWLTLFFVFAAVLSLSWRLRAFPSAAVDMLSWTEWELDAFICSIESDSMHESSVKVTFRIGGVHNGLFCEELSGKKHPQVGSTVRISKKVRISSVSGNHITWYEWRPVKTPNSES